MSVRRVKRRDATTGRKREFWQVDVDYESPDGKRTRIRKVSPVQTRRGAEEYERQVRDDLLMGRYGHKRNVPTFDTWFNGRYWREWVVARKNKHSTMESKKSVYRLYLKDAFGHRRLDDIGDGPIASFRAKLIEAELEGKTVNNILATLSKPLNYAADVGIINRAPRVGLLRVERPEIEFWEFDEYVRLLAAAKKDGPQSYAASCLAGEAGLRVGEVKGLRWRVDVDMVAKTLTINQQMRQGVIGTPKGRTRRTVPMTETLFEALKQLDTVREGLVLKNLPGQAKNDENQIKNLMYRICRLAGLPERGWHKLRHSFGTHAALFGVNPWRLMKWMGHKKIDETMGYVHVVEDHRREIPAAVLAAAAGEFDPDRRIIKLLGARGLDPDLEVQRQPDGNTEVEPVRRLELVRD